MEAKKSEEIVGKIRLDKRKMIGKGNDGGVVYEGLYENIPVAIKRICQAYANEADLLNPSINHTNLLHYYGKEENDDFLYLAMELCPGSLEHLINGSYRGPPLGTKFEIARQMAGGLEYLHARNITHGELKPQNILISQSNGGKPVVKLCDFGIAKEAGRRLCETIDSMSWKAPEFYDGEIPKPTKAGDIFSMGCVIGYLWTGGRHPFGEDSARLGNIQRNELHWRGSANIPEGIRCLIKRMIDQDPNNRPKINEVIEGLACNENEDLSKETHELGQSRSQGPVYEPLVSTEPQETSTYTLENGILSVTKRRQFRKYGHELMHKLRNSPASKKWPKLLKDFRCVHFPDINTESLDALCSAIFNAVMEDAQCSPCYAEKCQELWPKTVPSLRNPVEMTSFEQVFLDRFQQKFRAECASVGNKAVKEVHEGLENRHCTAKNPLNQAKLFGLVRLLEELYRLNLVPETFMRLRIMQLLNQSGVETSLKCACCVLLSDIDRKSVGNKATSSCGTDTLFMDSPAYASTRT